MFAKCSFWKSTEGLHIMVTQWICRHYGYRLKPHRLYTTIWFTYQNRLKLYQIWKKHFHIEWESTATCINTKQSIIESAWNIYTKLIANTNSNRLDHNVHCLVAWMVTYGQLYLLLQLQVRVKGWDRKGVTRWQPHARLRSRQAHLFGG